jgi:hypothetical protein
MFPLICTYVGSKLDCVCIVCAEGKVVLLECKSEIVDNNRAHIETLSMCYPLLTRVEHAFKCVYVCVMCACIQEWTVRRVKWNSKHSTTLWTTAAHSIVSTTLSDPR